MSDTENYASPVVDLLLAILILPLACVVYVAATVSIWGWFIVPGTPLPPLQWRWVFGAVVLLSLWRGAKPNKDPVAPRLLAKTMAVSVIWGVAWIVWRVAS